MRVLDLGCGTRKADGAVGVDVTRGSAADAVADITQTHLPFQDCVFDRVVIKHILEHVPQVPRLMDEIWRVLRPGGTVEGETPHYSSSASYSDPTHCHHFGIQTIDFLSTAPAERARGQRVRLSWLYRRDEPAHKPEVAQRFERVGVRLTSHRLLRRIGVEWAINQNPGLYEAFLAFILPARDIVFRLKAVQQPAAGSRSQDN